MCAVKTKKTPGRLFWAVIPWVWLLGAWLFGVFFMVAYGRSLLDSDMASEMVLAAQLNKEGGFLSTAWYYSTELRVFCEQLLFKLGLWVFPHNWHAARTLAQAILSALAAASGLYFLYGTGLRKSVPWLAGAMLCPFGFWQLFHCVFGGFYYVHMIFVMLSMGLVLRITARLNSSRRTGVRIALLAILSFAAGLNGIRILMNLYVPLVAAALVLLAWRWNQAPLEHPRTIPQVRLAGGALWAAAFSLAGYAINVKILAANHTFSDQGSRNWTSMNFEYLLKTWANFLTLFGYPGDTGVLDFGDPIPLFSLQGILGTLGLVIAGVLLASVVHLVLRRRELSFIQGSVLAVFLSCLLVDGIAFAFLNDMVGGNGSYWLPVLPLAFAVLGIEGETFPLRRGLPRQGLAVVFAAAFLGVSTSTTLRFIEVPPRGEPHLETICDWLVENGYTQGYATFWFANVMTELSDGTLEMWDVTDLSRMDLHGWLQVKSHVDPPEGEVFLIADPSVRIDELPYRDLVDVVYEDDHGFYILTAPEAQPILDAVAAARAAQ